MKKEVKIIITVVIVGILLGMLSKGCDVISQGNIVGDLFFGFGLVSSSFTIWIFSCLLISSKSQNKKYAALNVVIFLMSMLCSYYIYSKFVVGYLSLRVVFFWLLMIVPAGIAGYLVYDIKSKTKKFKFSIMGLTVFLSAIGIVFIEGLALYPLIMEMILIALIGIVIFKK